MQRIIANNNSKRNTNDTSSLADELQFTQYSLDHYNPDSHACQRCGKRIWYNGRQCSSYRRGITYVREGKRVDDECIIPICLCPACGKSDRRGGTPNGDYYHAILPDNLIPFTYFTLLFILTVLDEYAKRTRTVSQICEYWSVSISTLYRWKKRYKDHYDAWSDSMDQIRKLQEESVKKTPEEAEAEAIGKSLFRVFSLLVHLPGEFFSRFCFSFLQPNRLTHFRPLAPNRRL